MPEKYTNLEQRVDDNIDEIMELLFEYVDDNDALIHGKLENTPAILLYAEYLAKLLVGYSDGEQTATIYRAIHAAAFVADLYGCFEGLSKETLNDLPSASDALDFVRDVAEEYIQKHPSVTGMIDACMPEIDPSGLHGYLAETVAGFVGAQIEDRMVELHAARAVEAWDGTFQG